ncbi:MAG: methyl-accepting chemotaxis protein [Anaerolineales bacterium]|nr:MAG: methyl-accepting chemotaxis protein [Anaerolineales bacterium]
MSATTRAKPYLSLRYKLLIPLMTLGIVIFILSYFGARNYLRATIYNVMEEDIISIRDFVAACMDEDVLQALTSGSAQYDASAGWPAGMTDPRYWEQQACLDAVHDYTSRAEMYTYYVVDEKTLAYGLDQWTTLFPEDSFPLGDLISEVDNNVEDLWFGLDDTYIYPELEYDEELDLYYFAAATPLFNSSGNVVGGLSIFLDAGWAVENLQQLSTNLLIIFMGIFAVITILLLAITRTTMSELSALQATSQRVANGDYTPIAIKPHTLDDEVSTLARLFNIMLDKVRVREETLQKQVVELKIQIDIEKRSKDVKEIVDTEFFQDLKQRATDLRKRKNKGME